MSDEESTDRTVPVGQLPKAQAPQPRRPIAVLVAAILIALVIVVSLAALAHVFGPAWLAPPLSPTPIPTSTIAPLDDEIVSVLRDLFAVYQAEGKEAAIQFARQRGLLDENDDLHLILVLDTADTVSTEAQVTAMGARVVSAYENEIYVVVSLAAIEAYAATHTSTTFVHDLAALEHIIAVRLPHEPVIPDGPIQGEGVRYTGADVWHAAGFTGQGVKVGILDFGFKGYEDLVGTELPRPAAVKAFNYSGQIEGNGEGEIHGAACAEVVHEMAPGATLYFAACDTTGSVGRAVDWLLQQGVQVISLSGGWETLPLDGSGTLARTVDRAVGQGVVWVNAAGNEAEAHYQALFTDADGDGWHEFAPNQESMRVACSASVPYLSIYLNWRDWTARTVDYDLYLVDKNGNELDNSRTVQNGRNEPLEWIKWLVTAGEEYYIRIKAKPGAHPVTLDVFVSRGEVEYPVAHSSIISPADARSALAVGAVNWQNDTLEDFSSHGPTWDGRRKPDLAGPDRVQSASYAPRLFGGTSAACPHVAGAAALVRQAFPSYTAAQVREYLTTQAAVDAGDPGPDNAYGAGILRLPAPPGHEVPTPRPPTRTASPAPTLTRLPAPGPSVTPSPTSYTPARPTPTALTSFAPPAWVTPCCCIGLPAASGCALVVLAVGLGLTFAARRQRRQRPAAPAGPPPMPQHAARCPRCNAANRPGARFCLRCGQALPLAIAHCPHCGRPVRPGSRFCGACGRRI